MAGQNTGNRNFLLNTIGTAEIILGILAMFLSRLTGAFFVVLLGVIMAGSGTLGIITSVSLNRLHLFLGSVITLIAGILVIARPDYGLNFLAALIALYLIGTGAVRLFSTTVTNWTKIGGIIAFALGLYVLVRLSAVSATLIGVIVGINIIISGIFTLQSS